MYLLGAFGADAGNGGLQDGALLYRMDISRAGQNRIYTPYMTVRMVNFLLNNVYGVLNHICISQLCRVGQNRIYTPYMPYNW